MTSPLTYWRTIRHLRQEQILGRLRRFLPQRPPSQEPAPSVRRTTGSFGTPVFRPGPIRRDASFNLLNRNGTVANADDWNRGEQTKLWLYNLHYFDWLREQAAAQRIVDDAAWLDRWISDNPVGRGVGWEPYPLSIRIVNWIVWFLTIGAIDGARQQSLATQVRHLARSIEYHLLGNHLFANAKALVFAGAFFEGSEAEHWRRHGFELLERELPEQILADGAHFELSPMYHALVLEHVLDLLGLARAYQDVVAQPIAELELAETASRMTAWLAGILHPDGEIPYFNDAAFGVAPAPARLIAYAAARGVAVAPESRAAAGRETCGKPGSPLSRGRADGATIPRERADALLPLIPAKAGTQTVGNRPDRDPAHDAARCTVLQPSGYAVLAAPPLHLIFDCGRVGPDYLPGHAHADTLSFELSVGRDRVITNSGTSTYTPGPDREWERATRAHATLQVDGVDSAETWTSFRVGRRPNVGPIERGRDGDADWVECRHDGYGHLAGAPIHRRRVAVTAEGARIRDWIEGGGRHAVAGFLPVHPDVRMETTGERRYRLTTREGYAIEVGIDGPVQTEVSAGRFAPGFGITIERPMIEWRWSGTLPLSVQTQFRLIAAE